MSGFAPARDSHGVSNRGETLGISLHIYETDPNHS